VISACDDVIAVSEDSTNRGVRARFSQSLPRFDKGGTHEFFVRIW